MSGIGDGGRLYARKRDDCQPLGTRGPRETIVECCERDSFASLALQVQAAGELYSVATAQAVPDEQYLSVGSQLRCQFHENPGGKVGVRLFSARSRSAAVNAPSRSRRASAEATSMADSRLVAMCPVLSCCRTLALPASWTYRFAKELASK